MKKEQILRSFLKISADNQIKSEFVEQIADDCDLSSGQILLEFENGVVDIVDFYLDKKLNLLEKKLQSNESFGNLKIRQKIEFCVHNFFLLQKDDKRSIKSVKDFYFDPANILNKEEGLCPISFAIKSSYKIADHIWYMIGDKSTDFNHYTKRLILSKVLSSAFFVFLNDNSDNLDDTLIKIKGQIDQVMKIQKIKSDLSNLSDLSKEEISRLIFDNEGKGLKSLGDIVKNLPFIRLFN